MAKELKTLIGYLAGTWYVFSDPQLAYANIVTVKRSGQRYYPVEDYPTGTEKNFYHNIGEGEVWFSPDLPGNDPEPDDRIFTTPEPVHVIYTVGFNPDVLGPGGGPSENP